jgi:glycosyltransferase involved in cell wall biosynthesis
MRILYHHRTQGEEPESVHILSIVEALRELGHEVEIVGPSRRDLRQAGPNAARLARVKKALPPAAFELLQIAHNAVSYGRIKSAIRRLRPDLIYERYALYHAAGVRAARRLGVPLILEVNTPYASAWAHYYRLFLPRLASAFERWTLRNADAIITVTEVQRQRLQAAGLPGHRLSVCHNAVDPKVFDPGAYPDARGRLGFGEGDLVVGFVGTMNRWQGIPVLAPVIRGVLAARPDVRFLLVGDGEHRAALESACREDGSIARVTFLGRRSHAEIPPLVAAMDIAILPNSNDYGSPMKLFEYMAMEKAVVAPRVGPVVEILADGEEGLLIDPGDADQLARSILRLASDLPLRRRVAEQARRRVLAQHTWRGNAERILAVHRELVGEAG